MMENIDRPTPHPNNPNVIYNPRPQDSDWIQAQLTRWKQRKAILAALHHSVSDDILNSQFNIYWQQTARYVIRAKKAA
jgi:hypothetical protein